MAEVIVSDGAELLKERSATLGRFRKAVAREGIVKLAKERARRGAVSPSQRRREKRAKARRRLLRAMAKQRPAGPEIDRKKRMMEIYLEYPTFADTMVATSDDTWDPYLLPPIETRVLRWLGEQVDRSLDRGKKQESGQQPNFMFGHARRRQPIFQNDSNPSIHSCVIAVDNRGSEPLITLVRSRNDDGTEREKWQFPGGEVRKDETPEAGGNRETLEKTGLVVREMTPGDKIDTQVLGAHTFVCYVSEVLEGTVQAGDEIVEIKAVSFAGLLEMAERGLLMAKHKLAFFKFIVRVQEMINASSVSVREVAA